MKTSVNTFRPLLILCALALSLGLSAQDIHFSQYLNSPMNLGPGMAGVFGGDLRATANYRNQWQSVPVPYTTFSGVVENKFYHKKGVYHQYFTGGLMINYDRQGDLKLTSLQIAIPLSYTVPLNKRTSIRKNHFLTLGLLPTFGQRAFATGKWTFDAQWVDCVYDPGADNRESELFNQTSIQYFDLSSGINYRWQGLGRRTKLDLGAGWHHMTRPNHNFWGDGNDVRLQSRYATYASALVQVAPKVDIVGQALFQDQGGYREFAFGGGARFHLNQLPYKELSVQVGANYRQRYRDALIPHVEVNYRTWTMGLSYDINISKAKLLTNGRGGPELALIYRLYRVKPLAKFKSCPII